MKKYDFWSDKKSDKWLRLAYHKLWIKIVVFWMALLYGVMLSYQAIMLIVIQFKIWMKEFYSKANSSTTFVKLKLKIKFDCLFANLSKSKNWGYFYLLNWSDAGEIMNLGRSKAKLKCFLIVWINKTSGMKKKLLCSFDNFFQDHKQIKERNLVAEDRLEKKMSFVQY